MVKKSEIQIFLAHAHEDREAVLKLYARLKKAGYRPWLDKKDLIPGQNWLSVITRVIQDSQLFIACLSTRSISKQGFVQNEFKLALKHFASFPPGSIYFIPLRLDECEVPDLRQEEYGLKLRDLHWLDYWEDDGFDKLEQAISHQYQVFTEDLDEGETLEFDSPQPLVTRSSVNTSQSLVTLATILPYQILLSEGFGYLVYATAIPILADITADSPSSPNVSPLLLLENNIRFGQRHSLHEDIFEIGQGRYSHWDGGNESKPHRVYLWFSTPDNSDPRTNNRVYTIAIPQSDLPRGHNGSKIKIFDNTNDKNVQNGGESPLFNIPSGKDYRLISIHTYHWNNAQGKIPGQLGIEDSAGNRREWQAKATSGYQNAPNVNWSVEVNELFILRNSDGPYKVLDSDPLTWSKNSDTQGKGFAIVWVREYVQ